MKGHSLTPCEMIEKTMKTPSKYEFSIPLMVKLLESHEGHSITSQDSHKEKLITPDQQTENNIREKINTVH